MERSARRMVSCAAVAALASLAAGCLLFEDFDSVQLREGGDGTDQGTMDGSVVTPDGGVPTIGIDELTACEAEATPKSTFRIFDATKLEGAPDPLPGMLPLDVYDRNALWAPGSEDLEPDPTRVAVAADEMKIDRPNVLNIQEWGWEDGTIERYVDLVQQVRAVEPTLVLGYFDAPPVRNYSDNRFHLLEAVASNDREILGEWKYVWNARATDIAREVDAIFPSVFPMTDDMELWKTFATAKVCEAKQYGLPVYPWVWMQYDIAVFGKNLQIIPLDDWEEMLRHLHGLGVDGVVVYTNTRDGDGNRFTWTANGDGENPQIDAEWLAVVERLGAEFNAQ